MGGQTSATGGGSSLRLSEVGDLACMCVKTNTDPIMSANIEGGFLGSPLLSKESQGTRLEEALHVQ